MRRQTAEKNWLNIPAVAAAWERKLNMRLFFLMFLNIVYTLIVSLVDVSGCKTQNKPSSKNNEVLTAPGFISGVKQCFR